MAAQYISETAEEYLKEMAVKATKAINRPVTKAEIANLLILKAYKEMKEGDWRRELKE